LSSDSFHSIQTEFDFRENEQIIKLIEFDEDGILDRYMKRNEFGECLVERMQIIPVNQLKPWTIKQMFADVNDGLYVMLIEKHYSNSFMNEWREQLPNLYLSNKDTETEPVFLQYYPRRDIEVAQKFDNVLIRMTESGLYQKWFHQIKYTSAEDKVKQIKHTGHYSAINFEDLKFILSCNLYVSLIPFIILIIEIVFDSIYNKTCDQIQIHNKQSSDASKFFFHFKRSKGFIHTLLIKTFRNESINLNTKN